MYYEYVLCYVDDVLFISDDPLCTMKGIQAKFKLKGYKIEEHDMYLGAELSNMTNVHGQEYWDMSSDKYCTAAVTNVEYVLENHCLMFPPKCVTPLSCGYRTEMDVTRDIKAYEVQWYQELIVTLICAV